MTTHSLYVGGEWTGSADGQSYVVRSPATGHDIAELASAGPADVDRAVAAASEAFQQHRAVTAFDRATWCERLAEVLESQLETLAGELTIENGKPLAEATAEVKSAAEVFRVAGQEARRLTGETLPVADPRKRVMTFRRPRGLYAVVTPWNFPLDTPASYVAPALATGNSCVLKPAPTTARIALRLAECAEEAGVPAGLVNVLTGPSVEMAEHLVAHPGAVGVAFTGSTPVGHRVAQLAAPKHVLLELGGNGPVVVLDDADMTRTVETVGLSAFWNAGQSCTAAERILASPTVHDDLVEGLTEYARTVRLGEPWRPETTMGPLHTSEVADKMDVHLSDAVTRGARVTFGGGRAREMPTPLYYEPTVLADVPLGTLVHRDETFGPIAPVTRVQGDQEILYAARQSRLGLSCAIFTRDLERALGLAEQIETGQVVINDTSNYSDLQMPFGGWPGKDSGMGRVGGAFGLMAMTEIQSIAIDLR